jgi:hypothetical protein
MKMHSLFTTLRAFWASVQEVGKKLHASAKLHPVINLPNLLDRRLSVPESCREAVREEKIQVLMLNQHQLSHFQSLYFLND